MVQCAIEAQRAIEQIGLPAELIIGDGFRIDHRDFVGAEQHAAIIIARPETAAECEE